MRIISWLLGASALALGGAYVAKRHEERQRSEKFLEAARHGRMTAHYAGPSIIPPGFRAHTFRGQADGRGFTFIAKVDKSGTRWLFELDWSGDERIVRKWNALRPGRDHPLQALFTLLRRHISKTGATD